MHLGNRIFRMALATLAIALIAAPAFGQNLLVNPGFENPPLSMGTPPSGWLAFGNAYAEGANPPQFVPHTGQGLCSMFGNWTGGFNVSGIFQEFPSAPGEMWQLSSWARHWSGDALIGGGAPNSNWVVQKIAFFDASNTEIGGVESTILDGTFPVDVWHYGAPIVGTAPPGTVKVQALILYLQPMFDGGAAHIDDVDFRNVTPVPVEETTWGAVKALYR